MPALPAHKRKLLRSRSIRGGLSRSLEDLHASLLCASARRAGLANLRVRQYAESNNNDSTNINKNKNNNNHHHLHHHHNNNNDTPPIAESPDGYNSNSTNGGSSRGSRIGDATCDTTSLWSAHEHETPYRRPSVNNIWVIEETTRAMAPPSPSSLPPTPERNTAWVWPSRGEEKGTEALRHSSSGDKNSTVVKAEKKNGDHHGLKRHTNDGRTKGRSASTKALLLHVVDRSPASFTSTCSSKALIERPESAAVSRNSRSSLDGGVLDAPFMSHLCDMSMRFPEPPTAPPVPSTGEGLSLSRTNLKAVGLALPSLLLSLRWRKNILLGVSERRKSGALRKIRSCPITPMGENHLPNSQDSAAAIDSTTPTPTPSSNTTTACDAWDATPPPPPPPSARVLQCTTDKIVNKPASATSPCEAADIGISRDDSGLWYWTGNYSSVPTEILVTTTEEPLTNREKLLSMSSTTSREGWRQGSSMDRQTSDYGVFAGSCDSLAGPEEDMRPTMQELLSE